MDTQQSRRTAMAVLAIIVAIACFWLPGASRVTAVASLGVLTANVIGVVALIVGIACTATAIALTALTIRRVILNKMNTEQAALEAKQWDALPSREETSSDIIEPALRRVAKRYPDVAPLIEITFEQLALVHQSLDKIGDIFKANAGIISQEPGRYGNVERLIELMYRRICPGLVRIVYQAHEQDNSDTAIHDLIGVINKVNKDNQIRVDRTRDLANAVVAASTEGDIDTITSEVGNAIQQLTTTRKEEWL